MAKFEVYQSGKNKEFRFRLKADNGQTILSSEGYASKASCLNGIESVRKILLIQNGLTRPKLRQICSVFP